VAVSLLAWLVSNLASAAFYRWIERPLAGWRMK